MAYILNTEHALYANLVELIGVQAGALVSHKTARTFTKHAEATFGTGAYGEHFTSVYGGYTAKGAAFTPVITLNTYTYPNYTVVTVFNATGTSNGGSVLGKAAGGSIIKSPGKTGTNLLLGFQISGSDMGSGALMATHCRIGETSAKLYQNGTLDVGSTSLGSDYNDPSTSADYLLGWEGHTSIGASLVWVAIFDKELTQSEISDLYATLGANNAFGLVASGPAALNITAANSQQGSVVSAAAAGIAAPGVITIPAMKDWGTGNLLTGQVGIQVDIHNRTTGALVVRKTGQTTHATTGVCTVSDPAIVAGTTYEVVTRFADGSLGVWDYTAT